MKTARVAGLASVVLTLLASCAEPPHEAIDAARAALEAARRDPDVALYAPDALRAAEERLAALQAETAAQQRRMALLRNYDRASALAADAKQAGESARSQAASAKRQAGVEASGLIESAATALAALEIKAGQARRLRGIKLDMSSVIASIVEIRGMLESARSDLASLAYASSRAKAAAAGARIGTLDGIISQAMLLARKK